MVVLEQTNTMCTVDREEHEICSKAILIYKKWEVEARLFVDVHTFDINKATWQVLKGPREKDLGLQTVDALKGLNGYIKGKKELECLRDCPCGVMMKYLFTECMNGLIQGETCVYKQRGYKTPEEYNRYWEKIEKNGCRMYTHICPEDMVWMDYAAFSNRENNIFNRAKSCSIIGYETKETLARGMFSDSYHELNIEIIFDIETGIIWDCEIFFLRAPGNACFTNHIHKKKLVGENIYELRKRDVIDLLGRGEGCYHLVDITLDILRLVSNLGTESFDSNEPD